MFEVTFMTKDTESLMLYNHSYNSTVTLELNVEKEKVLSYCFCYGCQRFVPLTPLPSFGVFIFHFTHWSRMWINVRKNIYERISSILLSLNVVIWTTHYGLLIAKYVNESKIKVPLKYYERIEILDNFTRNKIFFNISVGVVCEILYLLLPMFPRTLKTMGVVLMCKNYTGYILANMIGITVPVFLILYRFSQDEQFNWLLYTHSLRQLPISICYSSLFVNGFLIYLFLQIHWFSENVGEFVWEDFKVCNYHYPTYKDQERKEVFKELHF